MKMFQFFRSVKASMFMVPLEFNNFNLSKSNCAWIEGTMTGSAVIGPDIEEFRRPGVIGYKTEADFARVLKYAMRNPEFRKDSQAASLEYVRENLFLSKVNSKRLELFSSILK